MLESYIGYVAAVNYVAKYIPAACSVCHLNRGRVLDLYTVQKLRKSNAYWLTKEVDKFTWEQKIKHLSAET